jgi:hypothetical protein
MIRKTTTVVLNCKEEFGPEWNWMPKKLVDLIPWVQKYLELVPEEYRASATFEIVSFRDSRRDYGLNVKVYYHRPETDEEMEARLAAEEAQKLEQQRAERQMLEDLKEKYSDLQVRPFRLRQLFLAKIDHAGCILLHNTQLNQHLQRLWFVIPGPEHAL